MIIDRALGAVIKAELARNGCVVLVGPYEVGKSKLAQDLATEFGEGGVYLKVGAGSDRQQIDSAEGLIRDSIGKLIVIDEIQNFEKGIDLIRAEIESAHENQREVGQFLLLGSASLETERLTSIKLGTRAAVHQLSPIDATELPGYGPSTIERMGVFESGDLPNTEPVAPVNNAISLRTLWMRGGFPKSLLAHGDLDSFEWRQRYLRAICARGYTHLNPALSPSTVKNFFERVAHAQGQTFSIDKLSLEQRPCLAHFEDVGLIRRLPPWFSNQAKRLEKSPKIYIRDSGLLHSLLSLRNYDELRADSAFGHSWEGFCIENLITASRGRAKAFHYRLNDDEEIDLVLEFSGFRRCAIEVKGESAKVKPGFEKASQDINAFKKIVVRPIVESTSASMTLTDAILAISTIL